ncbi:MAG TPA: OmpA family protein [Vicinamibacterales bacterium]|jgi:outer membrane protein OmpA-like peptidoglycan-associated protein
MRAAVLATIVAVGVASSACATKTFVRTQVGEVNSKVETLTTSVEETQQRTKANEENIRKVDAKADQVGIWAKAAQTSATDARVVAAAAGTRAAAAGAKAEEVERMAHRLLYEVVLSEDQGSFNFGQAGLPDEAKARIDQLITQLKADPRGAYIEIEGHTDNVGNREINDRLGLQRAETVKRYLYEMHQVPLHKMNIISYGEDKPVAPNTDRAGRAKNRRVVIKIRG